MKYDIGISNAIIVSGHKGYRPFIGSVGIQEDRICTIVAGEIKREACIAFIDGTGKVLMPGLVNGHCHGDMTLARGLGDDLTLKEQNEHFADTGWFYSLISDEDRYYSRQLTYCEALLSGTTFIMENMYWSLGEKSVQAMEEVGIRGALAEDIRADFSKPDQFLPKEYWESYAGTCRGRDIIPLLGSISEEDYDTVRLQNIKDIADRHQLFQTCHLAESVWRLDIIRNKYGTTPIDYLYRHGFLNDKILASHVVHAQSQEIIQLAETGTKVINTPLCEMKIADGIAPIPEMVRQGVTVCLGTDGAMWNNSNDLFREMKGMSLLHSVSSGIRSLKKEDILDMVTINGAKVFGMEQEWGTIEEGKKADFILIETNVAHIQPLRIEKCENVISSIIYNVTGRDVTDVFVNGRHVVENGELKTIDIKRIMKKVRQASDKIAEELSK